MNSRRLSAVIAPLVVLAGVLDSFERLPLTAPVHLAHRLKVRDLQPAPTTAGQLELLLHRLHQPEAVIAHMGRIDLASPRDDAAQPF